MSLISSPRPPWRHLAVTVGTALGASLLTAVPAQAIEPQPAVAEAPVTIALVDINDFHGRIDANTVNVAGTIEQLRAEHGEDSTLFLSAGDNIGASLFSSSTQQDQPTIDVLNALDLATSAVGNHEFDKGVDDLLDRVEPAADFTHLAANVIGADGEPILPAYDIFPVGGLDVAVIGTVTEATPSLVIPSGIEGLTFLDPVQAVNDTVADLEALEDVPDVIVAAYHEGAGAGTPDGASLEEEIAAGGAFADIVTQTDAEVDAIFTGHTHKQYAWDAPVPGVTGETRPVLQTGSYGENIGEITLTVDPATGEVQSHTAANVPRTTTPAAELVSTYPRVAEVKTIVDEALAYAAEVGGVEVATITDDVTTAFVGDARDDRSKESTLGNLVADSMLASVAATPAGADLALMNPGGLRNELYVGEDGVVTFAEANAVLPFTNNLSTVTLSGTSLRKVFEQQWQRELDGDVPSKPFLQLGTSANVSYTFDPARPEGQRITSLWVDDAPVDPAGSYKVAVPSFLTAGGDNFHAFTEGTSVDTGLLDYEAWIAYLGANSPVTPDFARHAVRVEGVRPVQVAGAPLAVTLAELDLTSKGAPVSTLATATLVAGNGTRADLGEFPVSAGSTTITATVPDVAAGAYTLEVEVDPAGTLVRVPLQVAGDFTDVAGNTFEKEIGWLVSAGITTGYADGTFRGSAPVLREQMAAFLYRYANDGANPPADAPGATFSDTVSNTFSQHIAWLAGEKITTGYADGTFRPSAPVLREQMAAFLYRLAGSPPISLPLTGSPFADVASTDTFYTEILWLESTGVTTGYQESNGTTTFRGSQPVLREQMAAFLFRFDERETAPVS
ncbi:5'-nucleotidase C-terminal domain-containing protein [Aeromicrobium sp. Sec7.5]|uniref:5'-nucleotidase C-terminal domain-containing protein n=1 Tax=Aeromicrobium sp. Sec7.5 TaxID=3121276 RepID=UPI002FE489F9